MREESTFCAGWEFSKCAFGTSIDKAENRQKVDIPHDWLIYNTNDLYETSTGWYRKVFTVPNDGRRTAVRFEGVYMDSKVYVNGKLAGVWKYGYTTFEFDITDLLQEGENLITVRVDHREPNSRWYSGAGIYRKVYFKRYENTHILSDGLYISADTDGNVTVTAETERPKEDTVEGLKLKSVICKKGDESNILAECESDCLAVDRSVLPREIIREGTKYTSNTQNLKVDSPALWDIKDPQLYVCKAMLYKNGELIDCLTCDFGFKKAEFTVDKGFFLNGRHVKIHGVCEHHDLGALGAAVNKTAIRRKLTTLRKMGVNAIRTSHNPPAVELLELCDEMGFLVLDEAFDMWERSKTEYDYARFFDEWVSRDVCSWVRRDRNRACLFGWSIGNEIYDTHASDRGQEVTSLLQALVKKHDPRGNGVITIGSNYMEWENARKCADILKVAGYNYAERLYDRDRKAHPDWAIYGSETSSVTSSRGIYHFPYSEKILCDDDEQCSALGNTSPGWAAKSTYACIIPDRDTEYCAGQFIWTGFDYIGEPTPYSNKNSYFGQIDTAGFPKDSFYVFKAEWTDYRDEPFVHIFPYWDFSLGQIIDVRVVSNAPYIKLLLNGKEIADKHIDHLHGTELSLDTQIEYTPGELTAIAFNENGSEIARDVKKSFGDAAKIVLKPDKTVLSANGEDLAFIEISTTDKDENEVYNANNRVFVTVSGEGRLVGLDNGDSTDYEQYKTTNRRLFSGKLLAIIASTKNAGKIKVSVASKGIEGAEIELDSVPAECDDGITTLSSNTVYEPDYEKYAGEIPVRKLEFISKSLVFTKERRELTFEIKAYPENASYRNDVDYRVTTALGIDTNVAEILEHSGSSVTVKALGDGEFYLRALCKNGKEKYSILSAIKLKAEGIGPAAFDPYTFIYGGLYTRSGGGVSNGIERGAGFSRDFGYVAFDNTDFGKFGSDTVIVPIYMNCTTPIHISFYDGTPDDGELLGEFEYCQPSQWLTYNKPEAFKLNKKLTGVHTFSFASSDGFEIRGFEFKKPDKEFSTVSALLNEGIYGDSFNVNDSDITHIGNNVVIEFGEFDFTERMPKKLIIKGRSELDNNSIHLVFTNEERKITLCEFKKAEEYTERAFDVTSISGKGKVSLTFLPGCDFDLESIRFE